MHDTRTQLLTRKRDLYAALRLLERDHADGAVDDRQYSEARERYENEAAEILEQIDALPESHVDGTPRPVTQRRTQVLIGAAVVVVLVAVVLTLILAVHPGSAGSSSAPPTVSTSVGGSRLAAAQRAAVAHPRDANAQLDLAAAYLDLGQLKAADAAYLRAGSLAPSRPEPPAYHGWVLGLEGHRVVGLVAIENAERVHPRYARAWLLDGLLLAQQRRDLPRAVAAWRHFLTLEPNSAVAAEVRTLVANAERTLHGKG